MAEGFKELPVNISKSYGIVRIVSVTRNEYVVWKYFLLFPVALLLCVGIDFSQPFELSLGWSLWVMLVILCYLAIVTRIGRKVDHEMMISSDGVGRREGSLESWIPWTEVRQVVLKEENLLESIRIDTVRGDSLSLGRTFAGSTKADAHDSWILLLAAKPKHIPVINFGRKPSRLPRPLLILLGLLTIALGFACFIFMLREGATTPSDQSKYEFWTTWFPRLLGGFFVGCFAGFLMIMVAMRPQNRRGYEQVKPFEMPRINLRTALVGRLINADPERTEFRYQRKVRDFDFELAERKVKRIIWLPILTIVFFGLLWNAGESDRLGYLTCCVLFVGITIALWYASIRATAKAISAIRPGVSDQVILDRNGILVRRGSEEEAVTAYEWPKLSTHAGTLGYVGKSWQFVFRGVTQTHVATLMVPVDDELAE